MATCQNCLDTGHVCENHPDLPWGGMCCNQATTGLCTHGACHCGGAGQPCPSCCDPIPEDGTRSIREAFVPRHLGCAEPDCKVEADVPHTHAPGGTP